MSLEKPPSAAMSLPSSRTRMAHVGLRKENKCIDVDWTLGTILAVFRTLIDGLFLWNILRERRAVQVGDLIDPPRKISLSYLKTLVSVDYFAVLPLPQILVWAILPSYSYSSGKIFLKSTLQQAINIQFILRLFRFLHLLNGQSTAKIVFKSVWANSIINLLWFVIFGHVAGSSWFFFGLKRVNGCLIDACNDTNSPICVKLLDCSYERKNVSSAWINDKNAIDCLTSTSSFSYGIFEKVLPLSMETNIFHKYVYALSWGFQQVSTLAGNQTPTYLLGEVLFSMTINGVGILLLAYFIGNVQASFQGLSRRKLEMQLRRDELEFYMKRRGLPIDIKRRVKEFEEYLWETTRGVYDDIVLQSLPDDIARDIRHHLFKFKEEVPPFSTIDQNDPILDVIRKWLKHKIYLKGTIILAEEAQIEKMVFIMNGELECTRTDKILTPLCKGDVCGDELLGWYLKNSFNEKGEKVKCPEQVQKVVSTRTVKCKTHVEAFYIEANSIEEVINLFPRCSGNPRV
ncbi:probable cyclic nucleotide-gated ion channel 20, chloroplastic [Vicia villosa]|uniref:probable cyclic nucleotide-gated ion channel 20, chloroplastic n=1 Tax=Vicia villosa TaxID=3911 RepID=UPI00273B7015|nr:probable cyclic nucleotide-gated ion channel 20, chloroplastic [Vicia villosa]